ncbi:MAG: hypothetical protein M1826_005809 [Phylliscum demangeonii]|nr:MAG: hypothetical protein M1826_005809 [Phylliscum demangeonii]
MANYDESIERIAETTTTPASRTHAVVPSGVSQQPTGVACATERAEDLLDAEQMTALMAPGRGYLTRCPDLGREPSDSRPGPVPLDYSPPVTVRSLRELELPRVINNAKLRHDINFDPYLHFRPNTEGPRGTHKREEADAYWSQLHDEFRLCVEQGVRGECISERTIPRICRVLCEIRDILRTLVPARDMQAIDDTFDLPFLLQQIRQSMLDFPRMARWLSGILKAHCAPKRDTWVDEMVAQFCAVPSSGQQSVLVDGVRMLFGILEAMKLDVANHQIRNLRTLLVEDTLNFEQHLFLRRIELGRLDARDARRWYAREQRTAVAHVDGGECRESSVDGRAVAVFVHGVANAVVRSADLALPDTFGLDLERLHGVQLDVHHTIMLEICVRVFESWATGARGANGLGEGVAADVLHALRLAIISLVEEDADEDGGLARWRPPMGAIALEIGRRLHQLRSDPSCPEEQLIEDIEARLGRDLAIDSGTWHEEAERVRQELVRLSVTPTTKFLALPFLTVADLTATGAHEAAGSVRTTSFAGLLAEVARRLAHVAALHWRVFGPLVYMRPDDD